MILVVCPNPAIDRTVLVDQLEVGEVHRGQLVSQVAGGKGLNVARALGTLGEQPLVICPVGGTPGSLLHDLAVDEGIECVVTPVEASTRSCTILTDGKGSDTVINETGPTLSLEEWNLLCARAADLAQQATYAVICGSIPTVAEVGTSSALAQLADSLGQTPWWADTSGKALRCIGALGPAGIKVNECEAAKLDPLSGTILVVTRGAGPTTVDTGSATWRGHPPRSAAIRSTVGAGDSFMAGWLSAIDAGIPVALATGIAAGTDNATRIGGGIVDRARVAELRADVVVEQL
jgi:fructose-1-phosphate kinase PfkB-like protein